MCLSLYLRGCRSLGIAAARSGFVMGNLNGMSYVDWQSSMEQLNRCDAGYFLFHFYWVKSQLLYVYHQYRNASLVSTIPLPIHLGLKRILEIKVTYNWIMTYSKGFFIFPLPANVKVYWLQRNFSQYESTNSALLQKVQAAERAATWLTHFIPGK